MINVQAMLIGGVVGLAVAFGAGLKFGADGEAKKCGTIVEAVRKAGAKALDDQIALNALAHAERDQAKAEVDKVNATTTKQTAALEALLAADQVKRDEAAARVEKAAKDAVAAVRQAETRAETARKGIKDAPETCLNNELSPALRELLNSIRATPRP